MQAEEALTETLAGAPVQDARRLRREKKTGEWLTVQSSTVNRTELGVQEWQDALFLKYGLNTTYPPKYRNSCNTSFSI